MFEGLTASPSKWEPHNRADSFSRDCGRGAVQVRYANKLASFPLARLMTPSGPVSLKRPSSARLNLGDGAPFIGACEICTMMPFQEAHYLLRFSRPPKKNNTFVTPD